MYSVPDKQLWLVPRGPSVLRSASLHSRRFLFHHPLGVFEDPMKEIVFSSLVVVQNIGWRGKSKGLRGGKTFSFSKIFPLNAVNRMAENPGFQNIRGGDIVLISCTPPVPTPWFSISGRESNYLTERSTEFCSNVFILQIRWRKITGKKFKHQAIFVIRSCMLCPFDFRGSNGILVE